MTLIGSILKKVKSKDSVNGKYTSPPPELTNIPKSRKRKSINKYSHVKAMVDSAPPSYDAKRPYRDLQKWRRHAWQLATENTRLLMAIKLTQFNRGKVDSRWRERLPANKVYYENRALFLKEVQRENKAIYKRILKASPQVSPTSMLQRDWAHNRREILMKAKNKFVLFPPEPKEIIEDAIFIKPPQVKRPRVYFTLRFRGGASIGELKAELFEDICPVTCRLFLDLLDGDEFGYGYVGTCFFRKVPELFWSGGDVIHDNGFGCYAQRGCTVPIGAENYHFPHSMPGLLSMRVTRDDEVCGIFNITFKPLPQFDLRNVVFGRIIRPSKVYETIRELGNALSTRPVVELSSARRFVDGKWRYGAKNTKVICNNKK
ncbi:unnamed protein product [Parnassius mnemosyne]|uniref:PPIase cyclophilin-type domain-containing protein n=1 Tax=Parnassius mnemosyne TaxID=213953 RepID=A0AAV1L181_9NEOP